LSAALPSTSIIMVTLPGKFREILKSFFNCLDQNFQVL
jgi:hypothetical protein